MSKLRKLKVNIKLTLRKGFTYAVFDCLIGLLQYLNLVELFKLLATRLYKSNKTLASRTAVDLFIVFKWWLIFFLCCYGIKGKFITVLVYYLIVTNLFTYFYHHTWSKQLAKPQFDLDRIRRRYLNLLTAIGFNILSFAYLFAHPFANNFKWSNSITILESLKFSFANALITGYEPVQSITSFGHTLALLETITSFIFLTIILSNSIPQMKTN